MTKKIHAEKKPSQEHSVPWFWPFAAAIEMEEEGLRLFTDNLKFVAEAGEIALPPPPEWATKNRIILDLGTLRLRDFTLSNKGSKAVPVVVDAPYAGHDSCIAGNLEEAAETASRVVEFTAERGFRGSQARALLLLGEISAGREPADVAGAEAHFGHALALARELGMRPLIAQCHVGLGRLFGRTGKGDNGAQHLVEADSLLRDMDMSFWREQVKA